MSSTASRTYPIGHVQFYPSFPAYGVGSDSLSGCLLTSGDGRYIVEEPVGNFASLFAKVNFDSAIPAGVTLDSITFTCKAAIGRDANGVLNATCTGYGVRLGSGDDFQYELYPWDAVTFNNTLDYKERFEITDWEDVSVTFTSDIAEELSVYRIPEYYMGLRLTGAGLKGFLAFDYARVTFNFTFPTLTLTNYTPEAYDTTPYSTKISFTVPGTEDSFNSTYPLTCWTEWTSVDPTNADDSTIPIETTPVQTFTATRGLIQRNLRVYDTLPSPLNVQSEKGRLSPNTTYWFRGVASLNGSEDRSDWASFTTPQWDTVTL